VTIAIVPARGGSKRIPRKNLKPFCGKPLLRWAIDAARASGLFDRIVVSTDDADVAELARRSGAETPFVRPGHLSDDHASTDAVILHAATELRAMHADFEFGCCVYPNPFVIPADLSETLELLKREQATSAFPVVRYDFPIDQALMLDGVRPRARWPEAIGKRSQDLPEFVHDAGLFYWFDAAKFLQGAGLIGNDAVALAIPSSRCQDLNTDEDWALAERKFGAQGEASS
jgi:N-acylneuraminate cytidylyltransferase